MDMRWNWAASGCSAELIFSRSAMGTWQVDVIDNAHVLLCNVRALVTPLAVEPDLAQRYSCIFENPSMIHAVAR